MWMCTHAWIDIYVYTVAGIYAYMHVLHTYAHTHTRMCGHTHI